MERMKHRYKDIEGSRRQFHIEISSDEMKSRLDAAFEGIRKTANIPGFRKGKAPRELLEKYHGNAAREKVLSDAVGDSYRTALKESNTLPVGMPRISEVDYRDGQDVTYKATVDMRPKVDLMPYSKIKVKKGKLDVNEKEVDDYIASLRESYAQFKSVEDRRSKPGDHLICDVRCERDGKPVCDERKNIWLALDEGQTVPELLEGLLGAEKGETREIRAQLPDSDGKPGGPEKEALFTVRINEIKEKQLPEIDDEFVKRLGTYKNLAELREAAGKDLMRKREKQIRVDISNNILAQLLKGSRFSPPRGLIDEEKERLIKEATEELRSRKIKEDDITKQIGLMDGRFTEEAARRVKLYFILEEISKRENISVTTRELDDVMDLMAKQSNTTKEKVREYYTKNKMLGYFRSQLREEKIIDFLISKAEIKEEK
jgi:trigger factor